MGPHEFLGVTQDADERAIKRAYALKLRKTRPDDDPEGFQRLHEAYQSALAYAQSGHVHACDHDGDDACVDETGEDTEGEVFAYGVVKTMSLDALLSLQDSGSTPPPPSEPVSPSIMEAVPDPVAYFDPHALAHEIIAHASTMMPTQLRQWLAAHEGLYSLLDKQQTGEHVFNLVAYGDVPAKAANLRVIASFFDFVLPQWVEQRIQVRDALASGRATEYGEDKPLVLRQLQRRFQWPQALVMACVPRLASRIASLSRRLESDYGGPVPGIDPQQAAFFSRIASPRYLGRWRWAVIGTSALLLTALFLCLAIPASRPDSIWPLALASYGVIAAGLIAWHGSRLMLAIHDGAGARASIVAVFAPAWVALAGIGIALWLPRLSLLAFLLVLAAACVHLRRFFDALRFALASSWLASLAPQLSASQLWVIGFAGAAIGVTLIDDIFARKHGVSMAAAVHNRWTMFASYIVFALAIAVRFSGS